MAEMVWGGVKQALWAGLRLLITSTGLADRHIGPDNCPLQDTRTNALGTTEFRLPPGALQRGRYDPRSEPAAMQTKEHKACQTGLPQDQAPAGVLGGPPLPNSNVKVPLSCKMELWASTLV